MLRLRCLFFIGLFIVYSNCVAQDNRTITQLEDSVFSLNNALKFKESQALLLKKLDDQTQQSDYHYAAALLLSYTYKRLFDYESCLNYLDKAKHFAAQTSNKKKYLIQIKAEEAFALFDTQKYKESEKLMLELQQQNFASLKKDDVAKLMMQLAYLKFLDRNYTGAEQLYNEAAAIMRRSSICDLPIILVKKMQLYAAVNQMNKAQAAYQEAERLADSCHIIKYSIYATEEAITIYQNRKEFETAGKLSIHLNQLNTIYKKDEQLAALHNQKEELIVEKNEKQIRQTSAEKNNLWLIISGVTILASCLLFTTFFFLKQKGNLERDLRTQKLELAAFQKSSDLREASHTSDKQEQLLKLTVRQRQILEEIAKGKTNKEIADALFISENTVKYHIKTIYSLLQIKGRKNLQT